VVFEVLAVNVQRKRRLVMLRNRTTHILQTTIRVCNITCEVKNLLHDFERRGWTARCFLPTDPEAGCLPAPYAYTAQSSDANLAAPRPKTPQNRA